MTFIMSQQEFVLVAAVSNHQHQMALIGLQIKNFRNKPFVTANVKVFTATIPAYVNPDFLCLPRARSLDLEARAHAGETTDTDILWSS